MPVKLSVPEVVIDHNCPLLLYPGPIWVVDGQLKPEELEDGSEGVFLVEQADESVRNLLTKVADRRAVVSTHGLYEQIC